MAKQLNVSLNFTANTAQAKASMQELQRQLNSLTSSLTTADLPITKEVKEATVAAANLKVALAQSMNVDTGKFDLSKFNNTLKKSGTNLEQIHRQLTSVGADGRKAFMSLAQSIAAAEIPSKRINGTLNQMWTTMKNTARWQLSSSALHAFSGALHSAFGYAKDLNESLNNIRIVTGQSTEQMAEFAEKANKAAKSLSTTTTKYTNASLIYYQQGLSDSEVQERTNTTVKMANVTGENAGNVSSYMTAIWNNFDDGSKSLEYFADVITKLGAETAASSEEIANGLEKFAAVGSTIGLSYEYATAALTTIIDKTRQSEDVVGTALKTIFARIQGLKMGEDTEDGLDLNKYSAALAQYGISIFDTNNELKDMDTILDEMGAKWDTLNRAQKVGLAQTVAGVRQYTQLISLMDNWDSMQQNVASATGAEGSLDAQAKIYEESWQAASNRVRAAMEAIFSDLIEDEFFIDLLNGLEKVLSFTDQLIDSAGGLKGVLSAVSAIVFKIFSPQISSGLQNMVYNIKSLTGSAQIEAQQTKNEALLKAQDLGLSEDIFTPAENAELKVLSNRLEFQKLLNQKESELSEIQKEQIKNLETINSQVEQNYINSVKEVESAEKKLRSIEQENNIESRSNINTDSWINGYLIGGEQDRITYAQDARNDLVNNWGYNSEQARKYIQALIQLAEAQEKVEQGEKNLDESSKNLANTLNNLPKVTRSYSEIFVSSAQSISSLMFSFSALSNVINTLSDPNISIWEKFISVSTSLTMVIPGLISGLKGINSSYNELIAKIPLTISASLEEIDAFETKTVLLLKDKVAMDLLLKAEKDNNEEQLKSILLEKLNNDEQAVSIILSNRKKGMTIKKAIAQATLNKEKEKAIILQKIQNLLDSLTLKRVLLLVAAIGALVVVYKAIKAATPDEVFKRVSEETENAKNAADEAKNSYEDLKNTISDYNDSVKALEELKKGTVEFEEAVTQANNKVLELLENYPELANYITRNAETGLLELSEEGQQYAQTAEYAKYQRANSYSLFKQQELNEVENDVLIQDAKIEYASDFDVRKMLEAMNESNNAILAKSAEEIASTIHVSTEVAQALKDNSLELIALQTAVNGNTAANDVLAQEMARSALQTGLSNFENSKYQSAISSRMAEISGEGSKNYRDARNEVSGYSRKEVLEKYEDLTGQEVSKGGFFHARKLKIEDENGEKKFISRSDAKDYIAQQGAYEKSGQEIEDYANNLEKLDTVFEKLGLQEDNLAHIRENLNEAFTSGEFQSIYEDLNQTEKDAIEKVWGENSDLVKLIAGEHFSKYQEGIEAAAANYDPEEAKRQSEIRGKQDWDNATQSLASSLELDQEAVAGYAKELQELYPQLEGNTDATMQLAKANIKFSQGFDDLVSALDDNEDALKNIENRSWMTQEALAEVGNAIESMLGIEVSNSFVEKHLEEIKKLANGDMTVLEELSAAAAEDYILNLAIPDEDQNNILGFMNEVQAMDLDIGATATLDNSSYLDTINQMLADGLVTVDQLQSAFNSIGYAPEIDYVEAETGAGTDYRWETSILGVPLSGTITTYQDTGIDVPIIGKVTGMTKINTPKSLGSGINKNQTSGAKKSGSGSTNEKERYHVVSNQVDSLTKSYESISAARENAFGQNKLDLYDDEINALQSVIDKNKAYLDQIETNLSSDKSIMTNKYKAEYDAQGNITNYDKLFDEYGQNEQFQKDLEQYEETLELYQDKKKEIADDKINEANLIYDRIVYKLEVKLDVSDMERDWLDYEFDAISDDVFKSAEAFGFLQQQVNVSQQSLNALKTEREDLQRAFEAGEITEEKYLEGLKNNREETINNLKALDEYDEQMKEYYENTLENAKDKLEEFTEGYENLNAVLEHYKTILELTGQEQDYDKMGAIYEAQRNVALNEQANAQQWFDEQKRLQDRLEKEYMENPSEITKKALEAQRKVTMAAQLELLEATEKTAEAINNIYENEMNKLKEQLEKDFTGGLGFDRLNESMQNISEVQSEYLTETNKLYETNKMLRDIQGDIDKTSNAAAKQRLNNFAKEIEQLQQKGKLSNLELEIAQAKYKQLQAQIALEEAQNAKSIVRLSRDNEGNYGYVYTADQDAISSAEQDLADAENDLYNIRLNAANEYGEKAIQAREELYEKLAEIDLRYEKDTVEWQKATEAAVEEYYDKMDTYTDLYKIAQMEDSEILKDAWVGSYDSIILRTEDVKNSVDKHILGTDSKESSVKGIFNAWKNDMKDHVTKSIGTDLNTLKNKTKKVSAASKELSGKVTELIKKLGKEIEKTQDAIIKHGKNEQSLKNLQTEYKNLATEIQGVITKYSELKDAAKQAREEQEKKVNIPTTVPTPTVSDGGGKVDKTPKTVLDPPQDAPEAGSEVSKNKGYKVNTTIEGKTLRGKPYKYTGTATGETLEEAKKKAIQNAKNEARNIRNDDYQWSKASIQNQIIKLDTGGYTGKWGPEGKLAMLHEKELVLNKEDTANMLKMVEIVRAMIDANVMNSIATNLHSPGVGTQNQNLEQNVTITAEFPNATDHNEIKMAFESLVNKASQYANRIR